MQPDVYASLAFCVNAVIMFTGYTYILTPRFRRATTILLPAAAVACASLLLGSSIYTPAVRGSVLLPIIIIFALFLFRDRLLLKACAIVLMEAIEVFADMATWPLAALTIQVDDKAQLDALARAPEAVYMRVYFWMIQILLIFVVAKLWNRYVRRQSPQRGHRFILSASLLLAAQVLFLEQMSEFLSAARVSQYAIFLLALIDGVAFLTLCIAFSLFRDSAFIAAEAQHLDQRNHAQQKYMNALAGYAASIEDTRRELYGSIDTLGMLLDYGTDDDVLRMLDQMAQRRPPAGTGMYAKNSLALNSLIAQKAAAAKDRGISFECTTDMDLAPPLSEFDACTILSNILDNALEGAGMLPEGGWIRLRLTQSAGLLLLECANACAKNRSMPGRGREHGMGQRIVQDAVRRNKGTMHLQKGDVYRVLISLPAKRTD